ncbi:MAG TPA: hypothetical protein DCL42_12040 [Deltaproteobacteria bacterium]|nr:hypothetical protein [Deltaproteobacteria bacterium]
MIIKMRHIVVAVFLFSIVLIPLDALSDLYQWQDEKGDVHVVDDMLLVPPQYKDKVKIIKTKLPQETVPPEPYIPPSPPPSEQRELYGEYPIEWWRDEFDKRKSEIADLEKTIAEQKSFINIFERGRGLGQTYSKEDIESYEAYKRNLPDNESKLQKLKAELEELRRKARTYGVPREIRE